MAPGPRDAATVVLLRDGPGGIETLLIRRALTMAFAPGMYVFPGGRVDEGDYARVVEFVADDAHRLAARASSDAAGIAALYSCAVRETLEEVDVDLAPLSDDGRLVIDPARLPLLDHWVTPDVETKRYDVRFFVAELPPASRPRLVTTEADLATWLTPAEALRGFTSGELPMLPPTLAVLHYLEDFSSSTAVVASADGRPIVPLLPRRIVDADGGVRWVMVNARTDEVLVADARAPHASEVEGVLGFRDRS
ncbi:MAG: NUDIX domain-containing protein [Actinobacteria bacterium]|nr:NUDIX domain-containing protein [Actinomycetota bacterium]